MDNNRRIAAILFFLCLTPGMHSHAADRNLMVFADASLKEAFLDAGTTFELDHFRVKVVFNFGSGSQLSSQIEGGAAVDVFASDDMSMLKRLAKKNIVAEPVLIAQGKLVLAVSRLPKIKIENLADLSKKGVRLLVPAASTPVARATQQFLKNADQAGQYGADYGTRVLTNAMPEEPDVKSVLAKLAKGEGDAGIVYLSDIKSDIKDKIRTIEIADKLNVVSGYAIATGKKSRYQDVAKEFVELLQSSEGASILMRNGLQPVNAK